MDGRKGPKTVVDKVKASKTVGTTVVETKTSAAEATATIVVARLVIIKPGVLEPRSKEVVLLGGRVETPEGEV